MGDMRDAGMVEEAKVEAKTVEQFARVRGLTIRDALVFMLDWRVSMLQREADGGDGRGSALLAVALRCVAEVMKSKIIARNKDSVGVVAFGVRGEHNRQGWPRVRVICKLNPSDAAGIRQLERLACKIDSGDADDLFDDPDAPVDPEDPDFCFGPATPVQFDKALWAVRHQFTATAGLGRDVLNRKKVFVITNDDDPTGGSSGTRQLAKTQAMDLADLGASLDVTLLCSPSQSSSSANSPEVGPNPSAFFDDLVYMEEDEWEGDAGVVDIATVTTLNALRDRIRRKEMSKRATCRTTLTLGEEWAVGVALFATVRKTSRPLKVDLLADTNKPVVRISTMTCKRVGKVLKQEDIRSFYPLKFLKETRVVENPHDGEEEEISGRSTATSLPETPVFGFTTKEQAVVKDIGAHGFTLYGFRKRSQLDKKYVMQPPSFLYPEDSIYSGSTDAFTRLHKTMLGKGLLAVVSVNITRSSAGPRFAALVPQEEHYADEIDKAKAAGFHMYYIPYKNDLYQLWRNELPKAGTATEGDGTGDATVSLEESSTMFRDQAPAGTAAAQQLIRRLRLKKFSPRRFPNPDLQRFYAGLEAAAIGEVSEYNPQDELLNPNLDQMKSRGGDLLNQFKTLTLGNEFDGLDVAARCGTKSAQTAEQTVARQRKRKAAELEAIAVAQGECDVEMYVKRFKDGTLDGLKKADLATFCTAQGVAFKKTMKKGELLIRVENHIDQHVLKSG